MMATAFLGYTLPWGQMSFWGATVITGFFGAVPVVGESLQQWLLGGYAVDNATLNRFFALHYLLPFIIAALVGLHVWALHHVGQNNPIGITEKTKSDTLSFHPFYTVKDAFAVAIFLLIFAFFLFYQPDALGHADNYIEADAMKTPAHIVPEWYFLPFYAILRAVPDKLMGLLLMLGAILVLFVLPWLDTSKVKSMRFRPVARWFFLIFLVMCFILGWCGAGTPDNIAIPLGDSGLTFYRLGQIATIYYFAYFLIILPILGLVEKPIERPESITKAVLGDEPRGGAVPAPAE
jgi:ubiquinol-cytochrome c reductase cytochrome b subunit